MKDPSSLNEAKKKPADYANSEMLDRINKLEEGMLGKDSKKAW
jgi:cell division septum initiation protein DivIVA